MANEEIVRELRLIQLELRGQDLAKNVRNYAGEGPKALKSWIKDMQKLEHVLATDPEGPDRLKLIALQSLKGTAADFASRELASNPALAWPALRTALIRRFSEASDGREAQLKLRRLRQGAGETLPTFVERIISTAEDAYLGQDFNNPLIQTQLVEAFIDGLREDKVAHKLIRDRPDTLERALELASREAQNNRAFHLRRRHAEEEAMEVDQVESQGESGRIKQLENTVNNLSDKFDRVLTRLLSGNNQTPKVAQNKPLKWAEDGKPICGYCDKIGHIRKDCLKKKKDMERKN